MSIRSFQHRGVLINECDQQGERHDDETVPAHPNGIPVSENRWLLIYATRRFRGNDDDCSIIYQLRADQPDGTLIREGMLAKATDDWKPEVGFPGVQYKKLHRHPIAFGVPKGALVAGREAANANVFALLWSRVAREFDPDRNYVEGTNIDPEMVRLTMIIEWTQVSLNDAEDELVTIRPVEPLRQIGFESGREFCSLEDANWTVPNMQSPLPYNRDCTEWVEAGQYDQDRMAARKYRFNGTKG